MAIENQIPAESGSEETSLTARIVTAYLGNNKVAATELGNVITVVRRALQGVAQPVAAEPAAQEPAVPIKKSVQPDYIVCLEDGKKFSMLKRHLQTDHGMTPDQYREKWNLPSSYPVVAPNYAKTRSELAKSAGLGRRAAEAPAPEPDAGPQETSRAEAAAPAAPARTRRPRKKAS
jgi:predicted transcriptional regulator